MEDMGEDEVLALGASLVAGVIGAWAWYGGGLRVSFLGGSAAARFSLLALPALALAGLWNVLATAAAFDVREDVRYQFLFVAMGTIWVFHLPRALALVGVSFRDDALERHNAAAAFAIGGTVLGSAALFAGSNMGEGPSIWNTVETAVVATGILALAVLVLAQITAVGDTIAVERDVAAGLRFAGWMLASGMVLARAAAGDWAGEAAMVSDLLTGGWPVGVLLAVAIGLELTLRPKLSSPQPAVLFAGVLPALGYVGASFAYVAVQPHWAQ